MIKMEDIVRVNLTGEQVITVGDGWNRFSIAFIEGSVAITERHLTKVERRTLTVG
jgi:hypothetical protein